MDNYLTLTSLNEVAYNDVVMYLSECTHFTKKDIGLFQNMLLCELALFTNTDENIKATNDMLHSYFINKLFPFIRKEKDILLKYNNHIGEYGPYLDEEDDIRVVFHIIFKTKESYHKFKLKYPKEFEKLNLFNETRNTWI